MGWPPADAHQEVRQALALFTASGPDYLFGWVLAAGIRACADLAEQARARRDDYALRDALAAAQDLGSWVEQMKGTPFTDHPFVAAIPAEPGNLGRRAHPAGRGQRPRRVAGGGEDLGGPGLAAPRRVYMVAARPGATRRRAARRGGRPALRAAAARRRRACAAAGPGPPARAGGPGSRWMLPLPPRRRRTPHRADRAGTGGAAATGRRGAPTPRSARSCSSAHGPRACTSPISCASWASLGGCRPPRWPSGLACWTPPGPEHRPRESKHHDCTVDRSAALHCRRILGATLQLRPMEDIMKTFQPSRALLAAIPIAGLALAAVPAAAATGPTPPDRTPCISAPS